MPPAAWALIGYTMGVGLTLLSLVLLRMYRD